MTSAINYTISLPGFPQPVAFDATQTESISYQSYKELIEAHEKEKLPYLIAAIQEVTTNGPFWHYFDAGGLFNHIFTQSASTGRPLNPATNNAFSITSCFSLHKASKTFRHLFGLDFKNMDARVFMDYYLSATDLTNEKTKEVRSDLASIFGEKTAPAENLDNTIAQEECFQWLLSAAPGGPFDAQHNLAVCYRDGEGTSQDKDQAFYWAKKAAKPRNGARNGDSDSQFLLSNCYNYGIGTPQNDQLAFYWAKKAAEQGHPQAQYYLALYYERGIGTEPNEEEYFSWISKAAENGDHNAAEFMEERAREKAMLITSGPRIILHEDPLPPDPFGLEKEFENQNKRAAEDFFTEEDSYKKHKPGSVGFLKSDAAL